MTLDDLKQLLNIDLTDTSRDNLLSLIVDASYELLEKEIHYPLQERTITERKKGKNSLNFYLSYYPATSVISFKEYSIDGDLLNDLTSIVDYTSFKNEGVIFRKDKRLFLSENIYEVEYVAGFTTVPSDLEYALRQIALSMHSQLDNIKDGVDRVSTPDGSFTYRKELIIPAIQHIIDKYVRISNV